jgi:hypothetical protein
MQAEIPQQDGADGDTYAPATRDRHFKTRDSSCEDDLTLVARIRDSDHDVGTSWHLNVPPSARRSEDGDTGSRCTETYGLQKHMRTLKYNSLARRLSLEAVSYLPGVGIPQVDGADDEQCTHPVNDESANKVQEEDVDEEEDVVRRKKRKKQVLSTSQDPEQENEANPTKNKSRLRLRMLESSESDDEVATMNRASDEQAATHEDERVSYASLFGSSSAAPTLATRSDGNVVPKKQRGDGEVAPKRKPAAKKTANQEAQQEVVVGATGESAQKTKDDGPKRKRAPKKATAPQEASACTRNHFDDVPAKNPAKTKAGANAQECVSANGMVKPAGKSRGATGVTGGAVTNLVDDTERYLVSMIVCIVRGYALFSCGKHNAQACRRGTCLLIHAYAPSGIAQ